jgi:hypothetical protein
MKKEHKALLLNKTYKLVKLPTGRDAINTHWVLQIKANGSFKARWVARGFSQLEGINYVKTYVPVLQLKNL